VTVIVRARSIHDCGKLFQAPSLLFNAGALQASLRSSIRTFSGRHWRVGKRMFVVPALAGF